MFFCFGFEGYYGRRNVPRMAITLEALLVSCTSGYRFGQVTRLWLTIVLYWLIGASVLYLIFHETPKPHRKRL